MHSPPKTPPRPENWRTKLSAACNLFETALTAGHSVTHILQHWCGSMPTATPAKAAVLTQLAPHLHAAPLELTKPYQLRQIELNIENTTIAFAQNWFKPAFLTRQMQDLLATSTHPFGQIVAPLILKRHNTHIHRKWDGQSPELPHILYEIQAQLLTQNNTLFCEVQEFFTTNLFTQNWPQNHPTQHI